MVPADAPEAELVQEGGAGAATDDAAPEENTKSGAPERVQVVCRVRPSQEYSQSCVSVTPGLGGDMVSVTGDQHRADKAFSVHKCFQEAASQEDVYVLVGKPSVDYVLQGFGACIFAYGQTGSGKTFTMSGTPAAKGLIPRMIQALFSALTSGYHDFTVSCQYMEVYMEKVRDLFSPSQARNAWEAPGAKPTVRFDGKRLKIENTKRLSFGSDPALRGAVGSDQEFAEALGDKLLHSVDVAGRHRAVRGHALNAESSRSHAVLILEVTARKSGKEIASTLMLVDLAGSENATKAGTEGVGKEEGKAINKSLFSLTRCIEALAAGKNVPWRESMLTKILTPALDGRSCCTLIATIRGDHATETRETLKFTETALKVKVMPKQTNSEALGSKQEQAHDLHAAIQALKQEIEWLKKSKEDSAALRSMTQEKEAALRRKVEELASLQRDINDTEERLSAIQQELRSYKKEANRERAARERAEAESLLLRAQLKDREMEQAPDRLFKEALQNLLQELAEEKGRGRIFEVLKLLVRLVRLYRKRLAERMGEEAHHAREALLTEFQRLEESLERCIQDWPEMMYCLADWRFVVKELSVQTERVQAFQGNNDQEDLASLPSFRAILDQVLRLCQRLEGQQGSADAGPRAGAAKLQGLVESTHETLAVAASQWQLHRHQWEDHWRPRLTQEGAAESDSCAELDMESVATVSAELGSALQLFRGLSDVLLGASAGAAFEEARAAFSEYLEPRAPAALTECAAALEASPPEPMRSAAEIAADEQLSHLADLWGKLSAAAVPGELSQELEESLHRLHACSICEEGELRQRLEAPSAAFVRDAVKWVHYGSPLFEGPADQGLNWNEPWGQDAPSSEAKAAFFQRVCDVVDGARQRWGWAAKLDPEASSQAAAQGTDVPGSLRLLMSLCIAVEADAVDRQRALACEAGSITGDLQDIMGAPLAGFRTWVGALREKVTAIMHDGREKLEQQVQQAVESVDGLQVYAAKLEAEKEQHLSDQREWEAQRDAMQQELLDSKLQAEQAKEKLEAEGRQRAQEVADGQKALQQAASDAENWRQRALDAEALVTGLREELVAAQSRPALRPEASRTIAEQKAVMSAMCEAVRHVKQSVALYEAGPGVQDLVDCLDTALHSHLEALKTLIQGDTEDEAAPAGLMGVAGFINKHRAGKRLQDAKAWAQGTTEDLHAPSPELDVGEHEVAERLHESLLGLADQHASVGSVRLDEERSLVAHWRASLKAERERRHRLAWQVSQLQAELHGACSTVQGDRPAEGGGESAKPATCSVVTTLQNEKPQLLNVLGEGHPEFCHVKALVEGTANLGSGTTMVVRRVRRVVNSELEERFREGVAEQMALAQGALPPALTLFHGANSRLCEVIAEGGFRLPRELGLQPGRHGDAVQLASSAAGAGEHCPEGPGRLRSLLVCDASLGRAFSPKPGEAPADSDGALPGMTLTQLRELRGANGAAGFDSAFVARMHTGAWRDEYAVYDPRVVMPRYVVDFDVIGLGAETGAVEGESADEHRLRMDIAELQLAGAEDVRSKCKQLAAMLRGRASPDVNLVSMHRSEDPDVWDRCLGRLRHAVAEGPGLPAGFQAVLTRLERVVNPQLGARFYERAAELLYPGEQFQWLLHGSKVLTENLMQVVAEGLQLEGGDAESHPYGAGIYLATSAFGFTGNRPGCHKLLLCEVALGRPMLARSARPNLDLAAVDRAGFDSLHAPAPIEGECDQWVVYNPSQALPGYVLSYDVQPRQVASELLQEMRSLEEQRRNLDEQLARALQELEDAKKDAEETRMQLDMKLAQQLEAEQDQRDRFKKQSVEEISRLDEEQARRLQEEERARARQGGAQPQGSAA